MARADDDLQLDAHAPAVDGVCAVLDGLLDRIAAHVPGSITGDDPEDLHQLRVAIRSSRAILAEMKPALGGPGAAHARQELAWLGRITGPARDVDVLADAWPGYAGAVGLDDDALGRVRSVLTARRDTVREPMVAELASGRVAAFVEAWRAVLADPTAGVEARHAERPLGRVLARRVVASHSRLVEHGRRIGPASDPDELHELRKDTKSVRYLVDRFAPAFEERARRRYAKRLRGLQRVLGAHQDADVHAAAIADLAADERVDAELAFALGRVHERLLQQRAVARAEFEARFDAFDSAVTDALLDAAVASIGS